VKVKIERPTSVRAALIGLARFERERSRDLFLAAVRVVAALQDLGAR